MMQQVPDTSTHNLTIPSVKTQEGGDSTKNGFAKDASAIADSSTIQTTVSKSISYAVYRARKAREDSIQDAKDSIRADSIESIIIDYGNQLEKAYSTLPSESEYYYKSPAKENNNNLISGILIACILVIAILWSRYRKRITLLIKSLFNWKLGKQLIRYEQVYSHPVNYMLLAVFVIALSIFVLYSFSPFQINDSNKITAIALCSLTFIIAYFFKIISLIVVGNIFGIKEATKEYIFHTLLLLKFCGVMLIPVLVLYFYSDIAISLIICLGVVMVLLSFIIRIYRGVLIGLQLHERLLSIFLYLCTLEILPALVIAKFLNDLYFR